MQPTFSDLLLWQQFFIIAGMLAIVTAILNLFLSSLGRQSKKFFVRNLISIEDPSFMNTLSRLMNSPIIRGGDITVLNNGNAFLPSVLRDIKQAQKSINFTVYIWKPGDMSDKILGALIQKATEGIKVRLLLDGFGGLTAPKDKIAMLTDAGGIVAYFRTPGLGRFTRFHKRSHIRAICIDDEVGYVGGMAVADYWLGNAERKDSWRDMMFRLTGPMVRHAKAAFSSLWAATTGEILLDTTSFDQGHHDTNRLSLNLVSSPSDDTEPMPGFFWFSIAAAKKSVVITTPYFAPRRYIRKTLIDLARKGVSVQVILPGVHIDTPIVRYASHHYYYPLLKEGIQIYEYQPTMIHSKMLVVDGKWSVIGSANMDSRSSFLNEENIVGVLDAGFAKTLEETFASDLKECQEITLKHWKRRNIPTRIFEYVCALFDQQF
jgi:cardiolipin synthase A/B